MREVPHCIPHRNYAGAAFGGEQGCAVMERQQAFTSLVAAAFRVDNHVFTLAEGLQRSLKPSQGRAVAVDGDALGNLIETPAGIISSFSSPGFSAFRVL